MVAFLVVGVSTVVVSLSTSCFVDRASSPPRKECRKEWPLDTCWTQDLAACFAAIPKGVEANVVEPSLRSVNEEGGGGRGAGRRYLAALEDTKELTGAVLPRGQGLFGCKKQSSSTRSTKS
mmetsp:Transcript_7091/g.14530  ORF Transcript_7091/g.14530 Transcript_7091/m.14530 type:complete len:121 (-) Transcript_7091:686-1048(-)